MQEEKQVLEKHILAKGLRNTEQRYKVLEIFLKNEEHLSIDELYDHVRKKYPKISHSTVFRSMKVIQAAGLAARIRTDKGITKYEHLYKHDQHGHMICSTCGKILEFDNSKIKELQKAIARKEKFQPQNYPVKIYGLCRTCQQK
jgi:Fur family transcriptional regulator, ferric uptake regulator